MIRGTIGRGGAGKTLYTVRRLWQLYTQGRDIISNTPLIDLRVRKVRTEAFGWLWVPVDVATFGRSWAAGYIHRFDDVYSLDNCEVLIDEMGAWMRADQYKTIPEEVRRFLSQDRREGVNIWWTHRTTRVFHEVLDNTAEVTRCERYGPLIVASSGDPQDPAAKPVRKLVQVSPVGYDLYDTYARVGSAATGEGYGVGKRQMYRGEPVAAYYECDLPCLRGTQDGPTGHIACKIRLRPEQASALATMYGLQAVGLYRVPGVPGPWSPDEMERIESSGVSRWQRGKPVVPGLAPPLELTG